MGYTLDWLLSNLEDKGKEADNIKKIKKILLRVQRWREGHGKGEEGRAKRERGAQVEMKSATDRVRY